MKTRTRFIVTGSIGAFVLAVVMLFGISLGYYFFTQRDASRPPAANSTTISNAQAAPAANDENPFSPILGGETNQAAQAATASNGLGIFEIIVRLFLSVILAAILAFRPRKNVPLFQRNLYVAQTQILLAVVAAALMMIVGDNAARAFAIFAAVSLVRFRTNIRDPKEITVLLISLALGLSAGVGKWELGIALCLFSLVLLRFLEYNEPEQVFRSMELTVKTRNTDATQAVLKKIFSRYNIEAEVRGLTPNDEAEPVGCVMYQVNLRLNLSTDYLSDRILAADSESDYIEGIAWTQTKNSSYVYQ